MIPANCRKIAEKGLFIQSSLPVGIAIPSGSFEKIKLVENKQDLLSTSKKRNRIIL
ncbi:hypothetical protein [Xenorhabdus vietnamensis]|uniref:hypothetical protein n=1 Tax=Xenorhabdus vietnamensis TaxID=351656 RepID=UPI00142E0232|nr:hypothetical protein [Xenorhabdus vietnamensis]